MSKLHEKSMFVHLSISMWKGRKLDKKTSDEVARRKNASNDAGRYYKRLVNAPELKEIERISNEARQVTYHWTLPWLDGGVRIIPNAKLLDYMNAMSKHKDDMREQVEKFLRNYPEYVADGAKHLGDMFNPKEYPTVKQLRRRFEFDITLQHIADDSDFRVEGAVNPMEKMEQSIRIDVWQRIDDTMQRLIKQLTNTNNGAFVRASVCDAVQDLGEIIPQLNLTDDPEVHKIMNAVKKNLNNLDYKALNADDDFREKVAEKVRPLAEKSRKMLEDLGVEPEEADQSEAA